MTKKQMLAECRRLSPDFTLSLETVANHGPCVVARATVNGKRHELSNAVGAWGRARIETQVLENALGTLRRTRAAA